MSGDAVPEWPELRAIADVGCEAYERVLPATEMSSDFNWLSLQAWCPTARTTRLRDTLLVEFPGYHDPAHRLWGLTGGGTPADVIREVVAHAAEPGKQPAFGLVPESTATRAATVDWRDDRDNWDYLYSVAEMIELPGRGHRANRWRRNKFHATHGSKSAARTRAPVEADWPAIERLAAGWAATYRSPGEAADELDALGRLRSVLRTTDRPDVVLTTIHVEDELVAFDLTEVRPGGWALQHFTHVLHSMEGVREELRTVVAIELDRLGVATFNAEQDLGVDGLRLRKLNDRPSGFVKKFALGDHSPS